jgi:hypothetical protein
VATYFLSPTAALVDPAPRPSHPSYSLMRHFRPWDAGQNVWLMPGGVLTTREPERESDAVRVFHGGHIHEVDDAEAALLTAAGFTLVDLTLPSSTGTVSGFTDVTSTGDTVVPGLGSYGGGLYGEGHYGGSA